MSKYINTEFLNDSLENELCNEPEEVEKEFKQTISDPFCNHFNFDLTKLNWPITKNLMVEIPRAGSELANKIHNVFVAEGQVPNIMKAEDLSGYNIKSQIAQNIIEANKDNSDSVTPLQEEILSIISNYQDFYYPSRL